MSASAVVNAEHGRVAIWHVATEPIAQTSRLCGAWVTDDPGVQHKVVAARAVILVGDEVTKPMEPLLRHDESRTDKGNLRAPIPWPALPAMVDWVHLSPVPNGVVHDPLIRSTIAVARWVADLADTWSGIETTRTARAHLCRESRSPLPLPLVLRSVAQPQARHSPV